MYYQYIERLMWLRERAEWEAIRNRYHNRDRQSIIDNRDILYQAVWPENKNSWGIVYLLAAVFSVIAGLLVWI